MAYTFHLPNIINNLEKQTLSLFFLCQNSLPGIFAAIFMRDGDYFSYNQN